jgi:hypothetical protein
MMRRFNSYGPISTKLHYYVPREELIEFAYMQLVGEIQEEGGHYITVWAPRQRGKSWVMSQVYQRLLHQKSQQFDVVALSLEDLIGIEETEAILAAIAADLTAQLALPSLRVPTPQAFGHLFHRESLRKPLILILDEFDTLPEMAISALAVVFRNIFNHRRYQADKCSEDTLCVPALLRRCETYFRENRSWLFRAAPRRADLRLYEAVYHFNLYTYIRDFLRGWNGSVMPEFPTGNGQVDLIIRYAGQVYAIEVKRFSTAVLYRKALRQAAKYAQQLGLTEVTLALFVEAVDDANRAKFEAVYVDVDTGVTVRPVFVETEGR